MFLLCYCKFLLAKSVVEKKENLFIISQRNPDPQPRPAHPLSHNRGRDTEDDLWECWEAASLVLGPHTGPNLVNLHKYTESISPSIRSNRGTKVVFPVFQPMRVSEEPVCIYLFRQNPWIQFLPPSIWVWVRTASASAAPTFNATWTFCVFIQ